MEDKKGEDASFSNIHGHIDNAHGTVIGGQVVGTGNITGQYAVGTGTINVENQLLSKLPTEYADSLKAFTVAINQQLKENNVPADKVQQVQNNVNEFSKDLEDVNPGQQLGIAKKTSLKMKLINIAKAALTILPKTLPAVLSAFIPLGPFSGLIGEDVQTLVQAIQKEV